MARSDRTGVGGILDRVRRFALEVETRTSILGWPEPPTDEDQRLALYDAMVTNPDLRAATGKLFQDGHYAHAVQDAFKLVNNQVKGLCGKQPGKPKDGPDLMLHAFDPSDPILRLNRLKTVSEKDEQAGYRFIFAGGMAGIRNPRAHEHLRDDADAALEMLVLANHLLRQIGGATRTRKRAATTA